MTALPQLKTQQVRSCSRSAASARHHKSSLSRHVTHASDAPGPSGRHGPGESPVLQADLLDVGGAAKLLTATAIICHFAVNSGAARAEDRPWKPRRHHRRLGERYTDTWAEELVEEQETAREQRQEEARLARVRLAQQKEADLKRIREEEDAMKRKAQEILVKQQEAARASGLPFKLVIRGTDFAPVVVWSVILAALAAAYRSRFVQWLLAGGSKQPTGGKWVYDRSLGGRKVWVPDSSSFGGPTTATSLSEKAGRSRMDEEFERLSSFAAAARTGGGASTLGSGTGTGTFTIPAWWDAPPVLYASASRKAACEVEAGRIMSRLEVAKNRGEDYSLADIRALRKTCQDGHVTVKPKTVGGRDAIFRAAVEAAVAAAQARNFESLDEASPPRFIAGVAADLGMEEGRAVGIAVAVVASAVRARLLDAVTNIKLSRTEPEAMTEAVYALARIASLLEYLPALDTETPQVDMVASSLRAASSVEERRYLFHLLAQLTEDKAALAARLLDFDPKLVIPEQQAALQAARAEQAELERVEAAAAAGTGGKAGPAKEEPPAQAKDGQAKDGQAGPSDGSTAKDTGAA